MRKNSITAFFGLMSPWALYILLALALFLAGAKLNGQRWSAKYERLQRSYESAQAYAQAVAAQQTQANAEQSAKLDKTYYEEFQNATKNSDYWRARYLSERVPSRAQTANCTETRNSTGVGNDTASDDQADRLVDVSSASIIELSESAKQMRAQVLYLQGKVMTDAQTISGEAHEN